MYSFLLPLNLIVAQSTEQQMVQRNETVCCPFLTSLSFSLLFSSLLFLSSSLSVSTLCILFFSLRLPPIAPSPLFYHFSLPSPLSIFLFSSFSSPFIQLLSLSLILFFSLTHFLLLFLSITSFPVSQFHQYNSEQTGEEKVCQTAGENDWKGKREKSFGRREIERRKKERKRRKEERRGLRAQITSLLVFTSPETTSFYFLFLLTFSLAFLPRFNFLSPSLFLLSSFSFHREDRSQGPDLNTVECIQSVIK